MDDEERFTLLTSLKERLTRLQFFIINHARQRRSVIFTEHLKKLDSGEHLNITWHRVLLRVENLAARFGYRHSPSLVRTAPRILAEAGEERR